MAATVTAVNTNPAGSAPQPTVLGDLRVSVADITGDASYPTGGYTVNAQALGLTQVVAAVVVRVKAGNAASAVIANYNESTGALQLYTATAEVANATNVSTVTARLVVLGY